MNYLATLIVFALEVSGACNLIVTRKEIRDLSTRERNAYFNAIKKLHSGRNDVFTKMSSIHYSNVPYAHGVPAFFPWHRHFIREYEKALQKIDPSVVLPYWDWSIDSQAPEESPIFSDAFLGGNGEGNNNCVLSGAFSGWQTSIPNRHCLRRNFDEGDQISSWYSPESIEAIINQSVRFDDLRTGIEGGPHGSVHTNIGGRNGDMTFMYSSNDPIFYLHHAFVDLIWNEWQLRNSNNFYDYNGNSVDSSDNMVPFGVSVDTTFDTTDLCYTYPRFNANLPQSQLSRRSSQANLENYVHSVADSTRNLMHIPPTDRKTKNKIRTPKPLTDHFINANGLNATTIRKVEDLLAKLNMALNSLDGFEPKSKVPSLH